MDSARFDGLVRSFSQSRSRRQTLRSLAGAVVVGAVALGAQEVGADTCKRDGKACKKPSQCCTKHCDNGVCVCPELDFGACSGTLGCMPVETSDGCNLCGTALTCDPCPSAGCPGDDGICVLGCAIFPDPPFPVCAKLCGGF